MNEDQFFDFSRQIESCATNAIDWEKIDGKTILITGATGMVGKYLIDTLLYRNSAFDAKIKIIAVGRDHEKFCRRFSDIDINKDVIFLKADVQEPIHTDQHIDYIFHMASNTHPRLYASDPIGTEMTNILGTNNMLKLTSQNPGCRLIFTSSTDIYGDNRSKNPFLKEEDCGYINCNTLRAGYIEGKRASEALCNAYLEAKGTDFVIARLCRIYGPTMQLADSRAISQFILNAAKKENIVLKSEGKQIFSYLYVYDIVTALLTVAVSGKTGNAYNVAANDQVLSLYELATILAEIGHSKVVFDIPDQLEAKGASSFQDVRLDGSKLSSLGWRSRVDLADGLRETVSYFAGKV